MKIAVIALASATLVAFAQPGFAQQKMDQDQFNHMDRPHFGQGMQHQFQDEDERSDVMDHGHDWSDRDEWRDHHARDDRDGGRMHRWSMQGHMQGRMTPPWRMHGRSANANEAARFRIRRGQAVIDVQCPQGDSLRACVDAAGQLLDKISSLRDGNAQGTTNGMGLRSGDEGASVRLPSGGALPNELPNRDGAQDSESGQ